MSTEKIREDFEVAFVAEEVRLCGEGMRSSALYMIEQDTVNVRSAWWAWKASRADIEVQLPQGFTHHGASDQTEYVLEAGAVVAAIESLGLRVKP